MKYFYLLILCCLIGVQKSEAACSRPEALQTFNSTAWTGVWYVVGASDMVNLTSTCNLYAFGQNTNPILVELYTKDPNATVAVGNWISTNYTKLCKFFLFKCVTVTSKNATFYEYLNLANPTSIYHPLKILSTDYSTYAVIWRCIGNDYVEVISDSTSPTAAVKTATASVLNSLGLTWDTNMISHSNNCSAASSG